MRKYWTKEMLEYLKTNYANESSKSIAERFDIELTAVYNKAFVLGLKKAQNTLRNIAEILRDLFVMNLQKDISPGTKVKRVCRQEDWKHNLKREDCRTTQNQLDTVR